MDADHILKCHGLCKLDRDQLLTDAQLLEDLQQLPGEYKHDAVQAALDRFYGPPPEEIAEVGSRNAE